MNELLNKAIQELTELVIDDRTARKLRWALEDEVIRLLGTGEFFIMGSTVEEDCQNWRALIKQAKETTINHLV